jgi:hypothetical protein
LALDGAFLGDGEFAAQLQSFTERLPQDAAPQAKEFLQQLTDGLKNYVTDSKAAIPYVQPGADAPQGIPRIVKEIADVFVKLDGAGGPGAGLARAAATQQARLEHIAASIDKAGAASPDAALQLNRIEGHVRLLNDISQYAYQQIPVQINDRDRTVELYVLNRGKSGKKINPDNANILIALDTDNLGHLETLINVTNKNLRLRFGVDNPALVGYVGGYTIEISKAMQAIGYKLSDMRMQVTSAPVTPLTVTETVEPKAGNKTRLDIKL